MLSENHDSHKCEIVGNRRYDNSLIYKCRKCGKSGLGLLGACGPASGPRGRRTKRKSRDINIGVYIDQD